MKGDRRFASADRACKSLRGLALLRGAANTLPPAEPGLVSDGGATESQPERVAGFSGGVKRDRPNEGGPECPACGGPLAGCLVPDPR